LSAANKPAEGQGAGAVGQRVSEPGLLKTDGAGLSCRGAQTRGNVSFVTFLCAKEKLDKKGYPSKHKRHLSEARPDSGTKMDKKSE
jgi:hypothetical protein